LEVNIILIFLMITFNTQ